MMSQPLYFQLSFFILVAECTQDQFPLNILTICTVFVMIVIVFRLFSDSSIMSDYEDHVPFLSSPSLHRQGPGSQGSHDYDYNDPLYEGSKSEGSMEVGGANDGSDPSRREEVIEPPPSQAGTCRTGNGYHKEQKSQHPKTRDDLTVECCK